MTQNLPHTPVMPQEVISFLNPAPGKLFLDATLGNAGHTKLLVEQGAQVIGIDQDEAILAYARQNLAELASQVEFHQTSFSHLNQVLKNRLVDGFLFDLGVSSLQLDDPQRGFSFRHQAPLDMRMNQKLSVTAADLVNGLGRKELYDLFKRFGEEQFARRITDAILERRRVKPIETTTELANLVAKVKPKTGHIHPATKVFQALRIIVNDELNELKAALPSALSSLKPGGVGVVISFHSLEDRIVKQTFQSVIDQGFEILTPKPVLPKPAEIQANPRSRSAKLRAIRKLGGQHV